MFSKNVIINNFAINKFWQIAISDGFDSSGIYDAAFDKTNTIWSKQHGICLNGRVVGRNARNTNGEIMRFRNIQRGGFAGVFEHQLEIKSVCKSCGLLCGHFKWHNPGALIKSAVMLHFFELAAHNIRLPFHCFGCFDHFSILADQNKQHGDTSNESKKLVSFFPFPNVDLQFFEWVFLVSFGVFIAYLGRFYFIRVWIFLAGIVLFAWGFEIFLRWFASL